MIIKFKKQLAVLLAVYAVSTAGAQIIAVPTTSVSSTTQTSTVALSGVSWANLSLTSVDLFSADFACNGYTTTTSEREQLMQYNGTTWVALGSPYIISTTQAFAGYGTVGANDWTNTPYSGQGSFEGFLSDTLVSDPIKVYQSAYPLSEASVATILSKSDINFINGISGGGISIQNTTINNLTVTGDMNGNLRVDDSAGTIVVSGVLNGTFTSEGTIGGLSIGETNNIVTAHNVSGDLSIGTAAFSVTANSAGSVNVASTDTLRDHNEIKVKVDTINSTANSAISAVDAVEIGTVGRTGNGTLSINDVSGQSNASDGSKVQIGTVANTLTNISDVAAASTTADAVNVGTVGDGASATVLVLNTIQGATDIGTVNNLSTVRVAGNLNEVNITSLNTGATLSNAGMASIQGNLTVGNTNGGAGGSVDLLNSTIGVANTGAAHTFGNLTSVTIGTAHGTVDAGTIAEILQVETAAGNVTATSVGSIMVNSTTGYRTANDVNVKVGTVNNIGDSIIGTVDSVEIGTVAAGAWSSNLTIYDVTGSSNASDGSKVQIGTAANTRTAIVDVAAASPTTAAVNVGTVGNGTAATELYLDTVEGQTDIGTVNKLSSVKIANTVNSVNIDNLNTGATLTNTGTASIEGSLTVGNANGGVGGDVDLLSTTVGTAGGTDEHSFSNLNHVNLATVNGNTQAENIKNELNVALSNGDITSTTSVGSVNVTGDKNSRAAFNALLDAAVINWVSDFSEVEVVTADGDLDLSNTVNPDGTVYGSANVTTADKSVTSSNFASVEIFNANGKVVVINDVDALGNVQGSVSITNQNAASEITNVADAQIGTADDTVDMANALDANGDVQGSLSITEANDVVTITNVDDVEIGTANDTVSMANVLDANGDVQGTLAIGQLNTKLEVENLDEVSVGSADFTGVAAGDTAIEAADINKLTLGSAGAGDFATADNVTLLDVTNSDPASSTLIDIETSSVVGSYTDTGNVEANKPGGAATKAVLTTGTAINANGNITLQSAQPVLNIAGAIVVDGNLTVAAGSQYYFDYNNVHADGKTYDTSALEVSGIITGAGAPSFVLNKLDAAYNLNADNDNAVNKFTLVGAYDQTANAEMSTIKGTVQNGAESSAAGDGYAFTSAHMTGFFTTDASGNLNYVISTNSYIEDAYAKNKNQAEIAKVLDGLMSVDNGGTADQAITDYKESFLANPSLLTQVSPAAMSYAARQNMQLSSMINMDTVYRVSDIRNYILEQLNSGYADQKTGNQAKEPVFTLDNTYTISVRSINGIAGYDGGANNADSNFFAYGGLINLDYIYNRDLFFGIGVGGFESKTTGEQRTGYAETQSLAVNAFADYAFTKELDFYLGLTYAHGYNEAYRNSTEGQAETKWGSDAASVFGGLRYSVRPYNEVEFYVRPILGLNYTALFNGDATEKQDYIDSLSYEGQTYGSLKSVVGVEGSYKLFASLFVTARALYLYEFLDDSYNTTATLISGGSTHSTFTHYGTEFNRNSAILGFGFSYEISEGLKAYLDYNPEISSDFINQNLNGGIKFSF